MIEVRDLACPYCFAASGVPCVEDCPQYPIFYDDDGNAYADPDVLREWQER